MILYQRQGQEQYYIGWYGMCNEEGAPDASDADAPCQSLNLLTGLYADGTECRWNNEGGLIREQLVLVAQTQDDRSTFAYFSMKKWFSEYNLYVNDFGFSPAQARAQVDSLAGQTPFPNAINYFVDLVCGKAYTIIVRAGNVDGYALGAVTKQVDLPEFTYRTVFQPDSGLRLTADCNPYV